MGLNESLDCRLALCGSYNLILYIGLYRYADSRRRQQLRTLASFVGAQKIGMLICACQIIRITYLRRLMMVKIELIIREIIRLIQVDPVAARCDLPLRLLNSNC